MKYCAKCGNEMFDEAVVCVKCGCPVEDKLRNTSLNMKKLSNATTAFILNIIAFFGNIVLSIFLICAYVTIKTEVKESQTNLTDFNIIIGSDTSAAMNIYLILLGSTFAVITFVIGTMIWKMAKDKKIKTMCWLYLASSIITIVLFCVAAPSIFGLILCGFGIIFFIPTILQIIASIKYMQAASYEQ